MILADTNPYTSVEGMLYAAIALFALAALGGAVLLNALIKKRQPPRPVVFAHGALAVTGLIILIFHAVKTNYENYPLPAIILFALAATGGLYLFSNDMRGKPGPVAVAFIHATVAVIAFIALVIFVAANR